MLSHLYCKPPGAPAKVPDNLLEESPKRNSQSQLLWDLQMPATDLGMSVKLQLSILNFDMCFPWWRGKPQVSCSEVTRLLACHCEGYLPLFAAPSLQGDADTQLPLTPDLHLAVSLRATQVPLSFAFLVFADTRFQGAREEREDSHQSQLLPARKKWPALITPLRPVPEQSYFIYGLMPSDLLFYILFIIVKLFYQFGGCFITQSENFFKQNCFH